MPPSHFPIEFRRAIVVGSSGGIGAALQRQLTSDGYEVIGLSRTSACTGDIAIDLTQESTIEAAALHLRDKAPFSMVLVSTGLLHDAQARPEKSLRDFDPSTVMRLYAVNAVGPALVAKHLVPLLPKHERCIFAALSARVGSIEDNRLGGWYGYRASKAALNMIIKTLSIELARTRPEAICVGLHPGTVDTALSMPFQNGVRADRIFSADAAAAQLLDVLDRLTPFDTGRCFAWDGAEISP